MKSSIEEFNIELLLALVLILYFKSFLWLTFLSKKGKWWAKVDSTTDLTIISRVL